MAKLQTPVVRFSYVHLFEKKAIGDGEPKYSVALLIAKTDTKTIATIQAAEKIAIEEGRVKYGDKWAKGKLDKILKDGDIEKPDDDNYTGMFFINAKNTRKPFVFNKQREQILDADEVYSGSWGIADLNLFPYNNVNNGVSASLNAVMKTKDGERLDSVANPDSFFNDVEQFILDEDIDGTVADDYNDI